MFFRFSSLAFTLLFTTSSVVCAANGNDLVIVDDVPPTIRQTLFKEVVDQAVPGKTRPDRYHVTLMWVEDIKQNPQHFNELKRRSETIRDQYLPPAHFTSVEATQLIPSATGTIVLVPTMAETTEFKTVNSLMYSEVKKFNHQHNTSYKFNKNLHQHKYKPHVTLVKTNHIKSNAIDPANVIQKINLNLENYKNIHGAPIELLQETPPVLASLPAAPVVKPAQVASQKPAPVQGVAKPAQVAAQKPAPLGVAKALPTVKKQVAITMKKQVTSTVKKKVTSTMKKKATSKMKKQSTLKAKKQVVLKAKKQPIAKVKKGAALKVKKGSASKVKKTLQVTKKSITQTKNTVIKRGNSKPRQKK